MASEVGRFAQYVQDVCAPVLGVSNETLEASLAYQQNTKSLEEFSEDSQTSVLVVIRETSDSVLLVTNIQFKPEKVIGVIFIKSVPKLKSRIPLNSQVRSINIVNQQLNDVLFGIVHYTFLPLIESFSEQSRQGDFEAKKAFPSVAKEATALDLALRRSRLDAKVPIVTLTIASTVEELYRKKQKNVLNDDELEEWTKDAALVAKSSNLVNEWTADVAKLIKLGEDPNAKDTPSREVDFWISLGNSLRNLHNQITSDQIKFALDFLMLCRKQIVVVGWKTHQANVQQWLEKVDGNAGINGIMRDFPLSALESVLTFGDLNTAIVALFDKLYRCKFVDEYSRNHKIGRFIQFVVLIAKEVEVKLAKILSTSMDLEFSEFEMVFKEQLDLGINSEKGYQALFPKKSEKLWQQQQPEADGEQSKTAIFAFWHSKIEDFLNKMNWLDKKLKDEYREMLYLRIRDRLIDVYHFRHGHELLRVAVESVEVGTVGGDVTRLLEEKFNDAISSPSTLSMTEDGQRGWDKSVSAYNDQAYESETNLGRALWKKLRGSEEIRDLFRILEKFGPLLQRPEIKKAIDKQKLFQLVDKFLLTLGDKLKVAYKDSEVGLMCRVRDYPNRAGTRMYFTQIRRQVILTENKLKFVLGANWRNENGARKVVDKIDKFYEVIEEVCGEINQDGDEKKGRNEEKRGQVVDEAGEWLCSEFLELQNEESFLTENMIRIDAVGHDPAGNDLLMMKVNFDMKHLNGYKEVRNFAFQNVKFRSSADEDAQKCALWVRDISLCVLMTHQAVNMYQSIMNHKLESVSHGDTILLTELLRKVQDDFKDANRRWHAVKKDPRESEKLIGKLYTDVTLLDDEITRINEDRSSVKEVMAVLSTCVFKRSLFIEQLSILQQIVDRMVQRKLTNIPAWLKATNAQIEAVLIKRMKVAITQWTANFSESEGKATRRVTTARRGVQFSTDEFNPVQNIDGDLTWIPVSTISIKFKHGLVRVEPCVEVIQQRWICHLGELFSNLTALLPQVTIDSTERDIRKDNFADVLQRLGPDVIDQAYQCVADAYREVRSRVSAWVRYQGIWTVDEDRILQVVGNSLENWNNLILSVQQSKRQTRGLKSKLRQGPVIYDCEKLLANVKRRMESWLELLTRRLADRMKRNLVSVKGSVTANRTSLERLSIDGGVSEAIQLLGELKMGELKASEWEKELEVLRKSQEILEDNYYTFPEDWIHIEQAQDEFDAFSQLIQFRLGQFETNKDELRAAVQIDAQRLELNAQQIIDDWKSSRPLSSTNASEALLVLSGFERRVEAMQEETEKIRNAQMALGLEASTMTVVTDTIRNIGSELLDLRNVWSQLKVVQDRTDAVGDTMWADANPRLVRQELQDILDSMKRMPNEMRQYEAWGVLALQLEDRLACNRVLADLKGDGLKAKYWDQIQQKLGTDWIISDLRVKTLWEADLVNKEHLIRDVLRTAREESVLEQFLNSIKDTWQSYELELTMFQKKCWVIKGWNDLFESLARDISAIEDMSKSPYFKVFESEAKTWNDKLSKGRDAFDSWLDVQRQFVYLEGIFYGSAEIKIQLPKEFQMFKLVESDFTGLMRKVQKRPQVMNVISIENLQATLDALLSRLGKIQKALGDFLERQRSQFCRFYFIGDEDLLEIIGSAKDPRSILKHLPKMFAGISTLEFSDDNDTIFGMGSKEGEYVEFHQVVENVNKSSIIEWLTNLETEMRVSLAHILNSAMEDLQNTVMSRSDGQVEESVFIEWIKKYPSQCILLSLQVLWSQMVDDALGSTNSRDTLEAALAAIEARLKMLSDTVLQSLQPTLRKQIEQVLTELVHQKDVIQMLIDKNISDSQNFEWLYQMRFYWNKSETNPAQKLNIQVANASFYYGFEYLGIVEKLVQTSLTDNIYLTLTQALHSKLGGCPFGPAGTGKTETVKMLGAQLGRFVLTFNCDENFDFKSMGRIFLGICQVGAWGCFDEFNRLEERMLSAVSQQILLIQMGLRHNEAQVSLLGRLLNLHRDTGIFITMNPGYAGRSNLPDNLKQLFRNMACTAPDKDKIASVMLYTRGFNSAESLSTKIVLLFQLCLNQLSAQPHYDFGLRALKSVLNSAGSLKRQILEEKIKLGEEMPTDMVQFEMEVLIQSIYDTIVPKLVSEDVMLLSSLVRDVFPGVEYKRFIEADLRKAVLEDCQARMLHIFNKDETDSLFLEKIWQLYQIQKLHHGLMLVGPSGCAKSTAMKVLINAMQIVEDTKYDVYTVDPKAITKDELYGVLDSTTMEWTDGILTSILRTILGNLRGEMSRQHWIVLDGDVDPEWVENLNSVLDDNKLLTLPNGERLAIPPNLHLAFEVDSLKYATLATVSRCGMVWFSDEVVTIPHVFQNYLDKLAAHPIANIPEEQQDSALEIQQNVVKSLRPYFAPKGFVMSALSRCDELEHTMEPSRMRSINSMWALVTQGIRHILHHNETKGMDLSTAMTVEYMRKRLVFSVIFGFGGDLSLSGRYEIADFAYGLVDGDIKVPDVIRAERGNSGTTGKVSLVDYEVLCDDAQWHTWSERVPLIDVDPIKCIDSDVVITTVDTIRNTEIATSWLAESMPMIFCGPPGSGKTMTLTATLGTASDVDLVGINFSAGTTPELIFQIFSQYCEIRKGGAGLMMKPKSADKRLVVFCDEINLPANDNFGTQRVITFIRQMVAQNGFWRASDRQWVTLERIQFVGACNPPTDPGRVVLSNRFLRYAPVLLVDYPSETSLKQIYGTFARALLKLHPSLNKYGDALTNFMVEVYMESKRRFTPDMQPHYIYSPRELSRYCRALYEAMVKYQKMTPEELVRLTVHEGLRLFYDRLIEPESRKFCDEMIDSMAHKHFGKTNLAVALKRPILFTTWMDDGLYTSVDLESLRKHVLERLKGFYEDESCDNLVVFDDFLHHILRIDRVLKQPVGHALLIGISGSGRSTLARFVAWMNRYEVFRIQVSNAYMFEDFEEDLRIVMKRAGCQGENICWIFDEMNALGPAMIERMNALLASGEVPGLFEGDEYTALISECRADAAAALQSDEELYKRFVKTVQRNLHIVFTMNPAGTELSSSSASSPALFNRCVVDWVGTWTKDTVLRVATEMTSSMEEAVIGVTGSGKQSLTRVEKLVSCVCDIHASVDRMSKHVMKRYGRYNFITPRSFLEFISQFRLLLTEKKKEIEEKQVHLNKGIEKLVQTKQDVEALQQTLAVQQAVLEEQNAKAEQKLSEIMRDQAEAEKTKEEVTLISEQVVNRNAEVTVEKKKVKTELAEVEPLVEEAQRAVTSIQKKNLDEIRNLPKPPTTVRRTIEMVGLMLGEKNISWDYLRKVMRRDDFIPGILNFDSESLDPKTNKKLATEYFSDPAFTFETVNHSSRACGPLFMWGQAQLRYTEILNSIAPLTQKIRSLETEAAQLEQKQTNLDSALKELEKTVAELKSDYAELVAAAEIIKDNMKETVDKVDRSVRMLSSLSSESVRWSEQRDKYVEQDGSISGDCLISAAFMSYAGYFDQAERVVLRNRWLCLLDDHGLAFREDLMMTTFLAHPDDKHKWLTCGLPDDDLCIENAAIIQRHKRSPLIIDPSGRAVDYLMKLYQSEKIVKTSFLDAGFVKHLESAVRFGGILLVQDVENLDPIVNPLLNNSFAKTGGRTLVSIGANQVDYSAKFKMFMVTRDPNPLFGPDICSRVTFANFTTTASSMENQCLNKILKSQCPQVEQRRTDLLQAQGELAVRLAELEVKLLNALSEADGNLLENLPLIATLETIKKEATEVQNKSADNEVVMQEVNIALERFRPLAVTSRRMFFALDNLSYIHFLYRFSLNAFMSVFDKTLSVAQVQPVDGVDPPVTEEQIKALERLMFKTTFHHFALSLKKEDHVLLAFRMCEISLQDKQAPPAILSEFLMKADAAINLDDVAYADEKRATQGIVDKVAAELQLDAIRKRQLHVLLVLKGTQGIGEHMSNHISDWQYVMKSSEPELCIPAACLSGKVTAASEPFAFSDANQDGADEDMPPPPKAAVLSDVDRSEVHQAFLKTLITKTLRPDRVTMASRDFINFVLGENFFDEAAAGGQSLSSVVEESDCDHPILLAAAPGYDVSNLIEELARSLSTEEEPLKLTSFAMGTSEAASLADKTLAVAAKSGEWVMLKNVHLDPTYLKNLTKTLPQLNPQGKFRLFLTSEISPKLPTTLLHQCRMLMLEAPGGVKANLLRTMEQIPPERANQGPEFRSRMYFLLAWLHAVLQERVRYYPVGWASTYEYGESDRRGTLDMVDEWISNIKTRDNIPWQAISTLISQSTYGGRVGNSFDQILLDSFLNQLLCPRAMEPNFPLFDQPSETPDTILSVRSKSILVPDAGNFNDFMSFVKGLPENESPVWIGLPPLAQRMISTHLGATLMQKLLKLRSTFDEGEDEDNDFLRQETVQTARGPVGDADEIKPASWYAGLEKPLNHWVGLIQISPPEVSQDESRNANPLFRCYNREFKAFCNLNNLVHSQLEALISVGKGLVVGTAQQRDMVELLSKEMILKEHCVYSSRGGTAFSEWIADLKKRSQWVSAIITDPSFRKTQGVWLGGLMSPEAFVTATRQHVAQSLNVSLQQLELRMEIGNTSPQENAFTVVGMMIEGAKFENGGFTLSNEITSALPASRIVWVDSQKQQADEQLLEVPVYLNDERKELVFSARVRVPGDILSRVWYQRGIAIILWSKQADVILN